MVTKSVQNAALLVNALSKNKGLKLQTFCEKNKVSVHYMEQVGRRLRKANIIGSKRGPGGGYFLTKDRVSAADIIFAVSDAKENESTLARAVKKALDTIVIAKKQTNAQNEQNA